MGNNSTITIEDKEYINEARLRLRKLLWKAEKWVKRHINSIRISIVVVFSLVAVWALYLDYKYLDNTEWIILESRFGRFLGQSLISVGPELAGIVIGFTVIDILNEWRQNERLKAQLIREMGASDNGIALRAVEEIRSYGWLADGSLVAAVFPDNANLKGVNLREANLENVCLYSANFEGADLRNVNLRGAELSAVCFDDAILTGADLTGADLTMASFLETMLAGANFTSANFENAVLRRAVLRAVVSVYYQGRISRIIKEASLDEAILWEADLEGADITPEQLAVVSTLEFSVMPDGSSPVEWALKLYGEGHIDEDTFNTLVNLANVGDDEEE